MKTARELGLTGKEAALYELIWRRTLASQMANARLRMTSVQISVGEEAPGTPLALFRASSKEVLFPGFLKVYQESREEGSEEGVQEVPLSVLKRGDEVICETLKATGHETRPPARYTEARLIKTLEQEGIGRPSTYATIIDTIIQRKYARRDKRQLVPTFMAFAANNVMEAKFEQLIDVHFTASMEQALDEIASGKVHAKPFLANFYRGEQGLEERVASAFDELDPKEVSTIQMPQWEPYVVRVGKYGAYVEGEIEGELRRASLPEDIAPGDVTREYLESLLRTHMEQERAEALGYEPTTGTPVFVRKGPYGWYVQLGEGEKPKRVSIPKGIDPASITLEQALQLLALPRTLGMHPETGEPVMVNIGRYGPYVQHQKTFASLPSPEQIFTLTLEEALALLQKKKAKESPLRMLGTHPETGEPVEVWEGRYGPYVKVGKINASLPKGVSPEEVTLEQALALLQEKMDARTKKGRKRTRISS